MAIPLKYIDLYKIYMKLCTCLHLSTHEFKFKDRKSITHQVYNYSEASMKDLDITHFSGKIKKF